jgi:hypothetical protein
LQIGQGTALRKGATVAVGFSLSFATSGVRPAGMHVEAFAG